MRRSSARRQLITVVALLAAGGVDPSEIARRAGHSSVSFTYDRDGHLFPEVDEWAAAKLDAIRTGGLVRENGRLDPWEAIRHGRLVTSRASPRNCSASPWRGHLTGWFGTGLEALPVLWRRVVNNDRSCDCSGEGDRAAFLAGLKCGSRRTVAAGGPALTDARPWVIVI